MTDEQDRANELVQQDLEAAFGIPAQQININEDLDGVGNPIAVRWDLPFSARDWVETEDDALPAPFRILFRSNVTISGVSLVDLSNETFERHIDWLDALHQLGFTVDTRRTGMPRASDSPLAPSGDDTPAS